MVRISCGVGKLGEPLFQTDPLQYRVLGRLLNKCFSRDFRVKRPESSPLANIVGSRLELEPYEVPVLHTQ